jgi:hypothetical protein
MEGRQLRVPASVACVVRTFLGSRLERELLARAFALACGESTEGDGGDRRDDDLARGRSRLAVLRKGA